MVKYLGAQVHGAAVRVSGTWAEAGAGAVGRAGFLYSMNFGLFALAVIEADCLRTQAAQLLRVHKDGVQRLIDRAVARGLSRRSTERFRRVEFDVRNLILRMRYVLLSSYLQQSRVLERVEVSNTAQKFARGSLCGWNIAVWSKRRRWRWAPTLPRPCNRRSRGGYPRRAPSRLQVAQ